MGVLKIATEKLLLVAGVVWMIAGLNIANIGIGAYLHEAGWIFWVLLLGTIAIFVIFHIFVFTKMVGKHTNRIRGYEDDRTHIWKFFDKKGYIVMAIMMGGGIALRMSGFVPEWFIAFFYTGLGLALAVAGLSFIIRYFKSSDPACPVIPQSRARDARPTAKR
ncbi:hypothetical protein [Raoultibacter phocaeensis]|uniref:hypothetical protein n=1 Tax=Raoultibacter phocaeensis TaxID=2479841 RepID=UPI001117E1B7|nr:hypothetical protein [Raoultibacter phocaeensis]